jgi:large subunit ribosomal protein L23
MNKLIIKPYITEKASLVSNGNAYTFEVVSNATKLELIKEINRDYKVKPVKINIVNLPARRIISRGRFGTEAPIKKAIVFLKKGDSIKFAA